MHLKGLVYIYIRRSTKYSYIIDEEEDNKLVIDI
jgi:hypothetical protein